MTQQSVTGRINISKILLLIFCISLICPVSGQDACPKKPLQPLTHKVPFADWYVVDTGNLLNYVSNGTRTFATGNEEQTFMIGRDDLLYPSMQWKKYDYEDNHYLYFGTFMIGYNVDEIRFNTLTSNDFFVDDGPDQVKISFSMTDELAGELRVGVRCVSNIYAFKTEPVNNFIIYEYLVINQSGHLMADTYVGMHFDCDVSSVAGGSGDTGFWRDDMPGYYLGTDKNGNVESISYMFDEDNPNIPGDDTGGKLDPPESTGYIGIRVLNSPPTTHGLPANQQSGHTWYDW